MKRCIGKVIPLAALILLLMPVMKAQERVKKSPPRSESMSVWQARRTIVRTIETARYPYSLDMNSVRATVDSLEFVTIPKHNSRLYKLDFSTPVSVAVKCNRLWCYLINEGGRPFAKNEAEKALRELGWQDREDMSEAAYAAESFAAAFNRLRAFSNDSDAPLRTFAQRASAWRALPTKPPIPEEVRVQRLLAEDAVKQKQPEEALNHYELGMELYPTWPQGHFNAALVAAELKYYAEAFEHMQAYLELVPDAPDAQSARDQIAIWQYKAKK